MKELFRKDTVNWKLITVVLVFCSFVFIAASVPVHLPFAPRHRQVPSLASLMLFGLLIAFFVYTNLGILSGRRQILVYLSLLLAKMTALFYNAVYNAIPMSYKDALTFHRFAMNILHRSTDYIDILTIEKYDFFNKFVASVYYFLGIHPQLMYYIMFICSLIIFTFIFLTAYELTGDRKKSQIAALLFMVWPVEFLQSVTFLREMPIQAMLIISVYGFVKYIKYKKAASLAVALLCSIAAGLMHQGMLVIPFIYLFIGFIYVELIAGAKLNPKKAALFLIIFAVMAAAFLAFIFTTRISPTEGINSFIIRTNILRGTTCYIQTVPHNIWELLLQMPYRLLMFALAPLPWQVHDMQTLLSFVFDGLLRVFIMYRLIVFFIRFKPRSHEEKTLLLTAGLILTACYLIYASMTFTYGTAMRHRMKMFPIEIILVYPCYELLKAKLKKSRNNTAIR